MNKRRTIADAFEEARNLTAEKQIAVLIPSRDEAIKLHLRKVREQVRIKYAKRKKAMMQERVEAVLNPMV